jgi:hypothetical protein
MLIRVMSIGQYHLKTDVSMSNAPGDGHIG